MYGIDGWDGRLEESNTANSAAAAAIRTGNQVYIKQTNERTNPKEQLWKSPSGWGGRRKGVFNKSGLRAKEGENKKRVEENRSGRDFVLWLDNCPSLFCRNNEKNLTCVLLTTGPAGPQGPLRGPYPGSSPPGQQMRGPMMANNTNAGGGQPRPPYFTGGPNQGPGMIRGPAGNIQ